MDTADPDAAGLSPVPPSQRPGALAPLRASHAAGGE
jgi:hypothetical protein